MRRAVRSVAAGLSTGRHLPGAFLADELGDLGAGLGPLLAFRISRYPVTYIQFQAFVDDPEGFPNPRWWERLSAAPRPRAHAVRVDRRVPRAAACAGGAVGN